MINNLGGTSCLELNIVIKEVVTYLRSKGVTIARVLTGSLMTSLEMQGISVTLLRLGSDDDHLNLLASPTSAPAWPSTLGVLAQSGMSCRCDLATGAISVDPIVDESRGNPKDLESGKASLDKFQASIVQKSIENICATLIANEEKLNALDLESGDGDCGVTHARMAKAILSAKDHLSYSHPAALMIQLGQLAQGSMGGSSGAVYSLGL